MGADHFGSPEPSARRWRAAVHPAGPLVLERGRARAVGNAREHAVPQSVLHRQIAVRVYGHGGGLPSDWIGLRPVGSARLGQVVADGHAWISSICYAGLLYRT